MKSLIIAILLICGSAAQAQQNTLKKIEYHAESVWYLIYDNTDFLIFGELKVGQRLATGRKFLQQYATEEELKARVDELKWEGYYEANK